MNRYLPDELLRVHTALAEHDIPHAFGGAIALAFYGEPRATRDLDINIALPPSEYPRVFAALEQLFALGNRDKAAREVIEIAQTRLYWGATIVDLFFADLPFHQSIAARVRTVPYAGSAIPIVSAEDLIVLKAAFNRPKDWVDIEQIVKIQRERLDAAYIRRWLAEFYAPDDEPPQRVAALLRRFVET